MTSTMPQLFPIQFNDEGGVISELNNKPFGDDTNLFMHAEVYYCLIKLLMKLSNVLTI